MTKIILIFSLQSIQKYDVDMNTFLLSYHWENNCRSCSCLKLKCGRDINGPISFMISRINLEFWYICRVMVAHFGGLLFQKPVDVQVMIILKKYMRLDDIFELSKSWTMLRTWFLLYSCCTHWSCQHILIPWFLVCWIYMSVVTSTFKWLKNFWIYSGI